jgi:hypothetical protein
MSKACGRMGTRVRPGSPAAGRSREVLRHTHLVHLAGQQQELHCRAPVPRREAVARDRRGRAGRAAGAGLACKGRGAARGVQLVQEQPDRRVHVALGRETVRIRSAKLKAPGLERP